MKSQTTEIETNKKTVSRRQLLLLAGGATIITASLPATWTSPIVKAVLLPAHAQTSMCRTDVTVGGPLLGNASGATSCQTACEAEAVSLNAQLCEVTETLDSSNATQCACDLDLP